MTTGSLDLIFFRELGQEYYYFAKQKSSYNSGLSFHNKFVHFGGGIRIVDHHSGEIWMLVYFHSFMNLEISHYPILIYSMMLWFVICGILLSFVINLKDVQTISKKYDFVKILDTLLLSNQIIYGFVWYIKLTTLIRAIHQCVTRPSICSPGGWNFQFITFQTYGLIR